jgi:small-conductance mechanosensitive channel
MQVFENALWIFFTHAFDVGDIVTYEDKRYTVQKIKLEYVVLERSDNAHVIVPTNEMSSARIHNITRCRLYCC